MAVNYAAALKTTRMQDVVDAIDVSGAGTLEIGSAAFAATLVTITLDNPCGSVSGPVLTFALPLTDTASGTGTAAAARFKDNGGNIIVSGLTVGTSGTDIVLNTVSITTGDPVDITSATITHSA